MPTQARIALVTGGSRGIGQAIAARLREDGLIVVSAQRSAAAPFVRHADNAYEARLDVREGGSIAAAMAAVETHLGALHVLVNNAGVGVFGHVSELPPAAVHDVFVTNAVGTLLMTQQACPLIERSGGGRVINLGSIVDAVGVAGNAAYGAAKAAVANMTAACNEDYKDRRVRFSLVSPGAVRSAMWEARPGFDAADMLGCEDVAQVVSQIVAAPLRVRIDAVRLSPPRGLL